MSFHAMKLNPDQLRQFQTDGYIILPHFFDTREVAAMQAELARLVAAGLLRNVADVLRSRFGIAHTTIQVEPAGVEEEGYHP